RGVPELRFRRRRLAAASRDCDGGQMLDARSAASTGDDVEECVLLEWQSAPETDVLVDERRQRSRDLRAFPLRLPEIRPVMLDTADGKFGRDEIDAGENRRVREHVVVRRDVVVRLPVRRRV